MKKTTLIQTIVLSVIQISLFIPVFVLKFLFYKKMGVERHIIYKNTVFSKTFNEFNLKFIIVALVILALFYFILCLTKYKSNKYHLILSIVIAIGSIIYILTQSVETTIVYYYGIVAIIIINILEILKNILNGIRR